MVKIYSCYHKPYPLIESDIIAPIHVGKKTSSIELGFQGDDKGENISAKNPYFCELTATYWIWKNVKTDIVGLFHYRRFFNFTNKDKKIHKVGKNLDIKYGITKENIQRILKEYDIILPQLTKTADLSVYDYYKNTHIQSDMDLVLNIIKQKHPQDYAGAEKELKNNSQMYIGNMLIARKEVFDTYAEWLFDILFEVEKQIQADVLLRDKYQQRVYGFLAERLMGVFVATHKNLKVKHQPLLFVEENKRKFIKYKIKQIKRKILTKIGFKKKRWEI